MEGEEADDGCGARYLPRLTNDHWVSRGYQQNFANGDKRVAVLDVASGRIVDRGRPIKSNFRMRGFTTFIDEEGFLDDRLEKAFASVERTMLHQIRTITRAPISATQAAAAANLFAVHLVRSPAYKAFHERIGVAYGQSDDIPQLANSDEAVSRFTQVRGRPPEPGEMEALAGAVYAVLRSDRAEQHDSMMRQHDLMAERLARSHPQVITQSPGLPGFAVGDTPIVHLDLATGRIGFRDSLALMDSTVIVGPISRRVALCFTSEPVPPAQLRTHRQVDALNAIFVRGAESSVACHPDDSHRLERVASRLDELPPHLIVLDRPPAP